MAIIGNRCSECEQLLATNSVTGQQFCCTLGCSLCGNLPVSKTGMSSPTQPIADPAVAREIVAMERTMGWTASIPCTECTCWDDAGQPMKTPPHLDSCPFSPLYNPYACLECHAVGFHKMSCTAGYTGAIQYEDEDGNTSWLPGPSPYPANTLFKSQYENPVNLKPCPLCSMSVAGQHADSCPAKPGHSCKFCGKPIYLEGEPPGFTLWRHMETSDHFNCGKQAVPIATQLTGTCIHGNARVNGCHACDFPVDAATGHSGYGYMPKCVHGLPLFGGCQACDGSFGNDSPAIPVTQLPVTQLPVTTLPIQPNSVVASGGPLTTKSTHCEHGTFIGIECLDCLLTKK